jgi:HK97 family phage prohead protease
MKTLTFDLKAVGDDGPGTFEGVMSAPVLDRDGEIIDALAFAPLPEHITIDIDHGLSVQTTVGSGSPFYDQEGILRVKGTFASTQLGQMTRTLVKEGHIRHMSVAFRDALREMDEESGIVHIRKGELINCTITGIPANTATMVSAKVGARNSMKDAERIQTAHDYMVELGATCGEKHVHAADIKESTDTETPPAAAEEAAPAGATVDVARALAALALARAALVLD